MDYYALSANFSFLYPTYLYRWSVYNMLCIVTYRKYNDANLVITWSRNPQSRLRSDPGKPK